MEVVVPGEVGADKKEAAEFVRSRLAFLRSAKTGTPAERGDNVGALDALRTGTDSIVDVMTTPNSDESPHYGLAVPEAGSLMCP